jgi:starvation-inducible DNA-binding protein
VGPHFIGVHQMLDPQYASVSELVDQVAERITTLGGQPRRPRHTLEALVRDSP